MFDFFESCDLENEEELSEERTENIKTEVLSRIKEEKTMKHSAFKTFPLAAIIAAAPATSVIAASAEKPSSAPVKQEPAVAETVTSETPESTPTEDAPASNPAEKTEPVTDAYGEEIIDGKLLWISDDKKITVVDKGDHIETTKAAGYTEMGKALIVVGDTNEVILADIDKETGQPIYP